MFVEKVNYNKKLFSRHELPINDPIRLCERRKIHLRMHAGKMSHGILKPLAISVDGIVGELFLCLLEELNLLSQLPLHLPQLDLTLGGSLLQLAHFSLCLLDLLLQVDHLIAERQDLRLKLKGLLRLLKEKPLDLLLRLTKTFAWRVSSSLNFAD